MQRLTTEQFSRFQRLIYQQCGIRLDDRKVTLLSSRLQKRLRALSIDDADAYFRLVTSAGGKDELVQMLNVITTNETSFFRTQPHFDWFTDSFIGEMVARNAAGTHRPSLRIWSAACSIGAEPYTLALCLADHRQKMPDWKLTILGTDLCENSLAIAKAGRFKPRTLDGIPAAKWTRYFRKRDDGDELQLRDEYLKMVTFRRHNLMQPLGEPPFDCVFLRNVLIYFDESSKQMVLNHITASVAPGGYLVIGPSEGIYGLANPLKKLSTFLYQRV